MNVTLLSAAILSVVASIAFPETAQCRDVPGAARQASQVVTIDAGLAAAQ